ncbi:MAG: type II secretion system F family protein, partial [bacterium]|nr:type II secretion system F family protein [bacterium]
MDKKGIKGRFSKEEIKKEELIDKEEIIDLVKQAKRSRKLSKKQQEELDSLSKSYIHGGGKISIKDLAMVTNQWAIMIEAGLDLKKSMYILFNQTESQKLKKIINDVYVEVSKGSTIHKSLSKYEKDLGPYFLGMVEAGEKSGLLDRNLKQLAISLERMAKIQAKVKSSLTYPFLIIFFAFVISFIVFQFVLPQIFAVIKDINVTLPLITQILISITDFMKTPYFYILFIGFLGGGFVFYNHFSKTKQGRIFLDVIKIKIPIFGNIIKSYLVVTFFSTISSLIATGTPMIKALEITKKVLSNYVFDKIIDYTIIKISEGKTLGDIFFKFIKGQYNPNTTVLTEEDKNVLAIIRDMFDPMARQMVSIGDETGKIDEVLKKYAD